MFHWACLNTLFALVPGVCLPINLSRRNYNEEGRGINVGRAATSVWCAPSSRLEGKGGVYCMDCDIAEAVSDFALQGLDQELTGVLT